MVAPLLPDEQVYALAEQLMPEQVRVLRKVDEIDNSKSR